MNARMNHLLDEALTLAPDERSALLVALLDSLDGGDETAANKAWADEIRQRRAGLRSGVTQAAPWTEVRARLSVL
jgi:putative addiction module component (TIGR02574 family)